MGLMLVKWRSLLLLLQTCLIQRDKSQGNRRLADHKVFPLIEDAIRIFASFITVYMVLHFVSPIVFMSCGDHPKRCPGCGLRELFCRPRACFELGFSGAFSVFRLLQYCICRSYCCGEMIAFLGIGESSVCELSAIALGVVVRKHVTSFRVFKGDVLGMVKMCLLWYLENIDIQSHLFLLQYSQMKSKVSPPPFSLTNPPTL